MSGYGTSQVSRDPRLGVDRRTFLRFAGGVGAVLPLAALTGCGGSAAAEGHVIRIAYQQFGSGTLWEDWINAAAERYTSQHPDRIVELVPIVAAENDYYTKNELLMSSPRTSPDVAYADTFILLSDVGAGYLQPVDEFVEQWGDWQEIAQASRDAVKAEDGLTYAVPTHTDTRAIWFNKEVFAQAGLPEEWAPQDWAEILEAARTIKAELPDVAPMVIYSGKPQGEKASMQGFEMLLYGTASTLYDEDTSRWVIGSAGFLESLQLLETVFEEELTLSLAQNLDPNISETIYSRLLPEAQLGMVIDGSWVSQNWVEGGTSPWPEWTETMGLARMPTQHGQDPGFVTLSGGWCLTLPEYSSDPEIAFSFIEALCEKDVMVDFTIANNYITVREDVAADERYQSYSPTAEFFTSLLEGAYYRPALPAYPEVSNAIQEAMEAVMTRSQTPEQAAAAYAAAVTDIVGPENVQDESS
ncbi:substrate-binding domain-containing protein [Nesterenkonia sp. HG001]|uniref:substrate-binding domain-containing protein n=1 Tax=Nesterenkonia sp. HG001 TaxID=2983207 RepID=UPI002AC5B395|nr:substrate-binding domain-containing protein [Nesterenkonia sp. HG001]MDZ5078312.1 substrate-binding domain-containing protein [Nesterenkonia sp. HG001]